MIFAMPEVRWIFGSLFVALVLASIAGWVMARRRPGRFVENFNARVRSWWVIVALGGLSLAGGWIAIAVLFAVLSYLALAEFLTVEPGESWKQDTLRCLLYLCVPFPYFLTFTGDAARFSWWPPAFLAALLPAAIFQLAPPHLANRAGAWVICVCGLAYVPAISRLPVEQPLLVALFLVLVTQVSDILQYAWGHAAGRHPIAPAISPSKTVEGTVGGILSASAVGALLQPITPFTRAEAAAMALLIAVAGFAGGLVLSAVKRRRGIKDWGSWIPGHGGVLDRVDSLWLSAPVFFHVVWYVRRD